MPNTIPYMETKLPVADFEYSQKASIKELIISY